MSTKNGNPGASRWDKLIARCRARYSLPPPPFPRHLQPFGCSWLICRSSWRAVQAHAAKQVGMGRPVSCLNFLIPIHRLRATFLRASARMSSVVKILSSSDTDVPDFPDSAAITGLESGFRRAFTFRAAPRRVS